MSAEEARVASALAGAIRRHWGLFLAEGIVLLILGLLAVSAPAIASLATTVFFGWILLISGVVGLITTFRARQVAGFWWSLVSAVIGIVAGLLLLAWPQPGVLSLTAVLIAFLFAEGIVTILYAFEHRGALSGRWGWMLASGIVDVCLGALLFAGFPGTAVWALGLLLGINLLFGGWALILMALHARTSGANAS
jgi:uncharacterized membrane protein HdeD (DUF308 family)